MDAINSTIAVLNFIVGIGVICMLGTHQRLVKFPRTHKAGLWLAGVAQVYQAIDYFQLGADFHHELVVLPPVSYMIIVGSIIYKNRAARIHTQ